MSDLIQDRQIKASLYYRAFSGRGIEFAPLATKPGQTGIVLHETGYLPANRDWMHSNVFSPIWRLYYNENGGHFVRIGESSVELTPSHILLIPAHCLCHFTGLHPVPHFWLTFSIARTLAADISLPVLLKPRAAELCLIHEAQQLILTDTSMAPESELLGYGMALLDVVLSRPEAHTDRTLDAIAEQTGFPNRAYFSRVFKKVTDESPARFRRKHRRIT